MNKDTYNKLPSDGSDTSDLNKEVLEWIHSEEGEKIIKADIENQWSAFSDDQSTGSERGKMFEKITSAIDLEPTTLPAAKTRSLRSMSRWVAAIIIPLLMGITIGYFIAAEQKGDSLQEVNIARFMDEPTLTLPDGSEVVLDQTTEDTLIAEEGDVVIHREEGRLIHEKQQEVADKPKEIQWSTMNVPKGKKFNLVLEDGTQVWLNADTKLRFPIAFSGNERRVYLEGEAYFIVKENKEKPFIVETPEQSLTVLGTSFNIYAYPQSTLEHTTLVEGKISVSTTSIDESVILKPGQQAVLTAHAESFSVHKVNTDLVTVWRDDVFALEGNTLSEVFMKLSRWYDFEYHFEDTEVSNLILSGNLRMSDNIGFIFEVIESLGHVKIHVKNNQVKIMKK